MKSETSVIISILSVMLESVNSLQKNFGLFFKYLEWIITIVFTIEYLIRLWVVRHPLKFVFSFFGIIDFLAFLPSYIGLFISGTHGLMVIRALRLLRIFRILKINRYINESNYLISALKASRVKISIFLYAVLMIIIVVGSVMYLVEGEQNGFDSIPRSMYWVIVTITTVGFGDIVPQTTVGQMIASFIMILGYAIIAVPTGIVSAEMGRSRTNTPNNDNTIVCQECLKEGHEKDSSFCRYCGSNFEDQTSNPTSQNT
ncbi:MAG: ion transporter [Salinivirgaceae bacterium]|jgi:voltage-gated potassium channel|nr:ion transporter [Salinivirgaceae bacterium]